MSTEKEIETFFAQYDEQVYKLAMQARKVILKALPGITEEIDVPAKIVGYAYGKKYLESVCVLIPSKKGLKLGLNRAVDLPDPEKILEGAGKVHKYIVIDSIETIRSTALKNMLKVAHEACMSRMDKQ